MATAVQADIIDMHQHGKTSEVYTRNRVQAMSQLIARLDPGFPLSATQNGSIRKCGFLKYLQGIYQNTLRLDSRSH